MRGVVANKPFAEGAEVFMNAACVVSMVDRLVLRMDYDVRHSGRLLEWLFHFEAAVAPVTCQMAVESRFMLFT